jgi:hypothetical protein
MGHRIALVFTCFTALVHATAQEPAEPTILKNNGAPMKVEYACTEDDLQWAGLACSAEDPCPVYLELSAVAPSGKKIIASGNLHSTSGTLYSILLVSDDGGAAWKEPAKRIRGASLEQLQFYDLQTGWAAGETLFPLPADPFLLLTTDGGGSWRERPITDEGGSGSVQRFWFDSAQHGELIVDRGSGGASGRYELYESQTGGESWMIRATADRAPRIRVAPESTEHSDWRIRADQNGNVFRIEKRMGESWTPVASFLIHVTDCKPEPPAVKEPPSGESDAPTAQKDYVEELRLGGPPTQTDTKKKPKK